MSKFFLAVIAYFNPTVHKALANLEKHLAALEAAADAHLHNVSVSKLEASFHRAAAEVAETVAAEEQDLADKAVRVKAKLADLLS